MSLSARWKMYTWAPRPKNSIISWVKSWPYTICLLILSHLQSGHLQTESENPQKSSWCNGCCNRKRWTALKIHPLPWCQGKWDLAGHAGSPNVWYLTHFQRAHTLTRCTSSTRLSSPSNVTVGLCARGFSLGGIDSLRGFFFHCLVFPPPYVTLPFSVANVHLNQPAWLLSGAFLRHVKSALSTFLSLHPLAPPGSGTLWAPWQKWSSDLPP